MSKLPRQPLFLALIAIVTACGGAEAPSSEADSGQAAEADAAQIATLVELRGSGGLASPALPAGTFLGQGAQLRAGQTLKTPAGVRAELALNDGTRLRVDEQSEFVLPARDGGAIELRAGRAILVAGASPASLASHGEVAELSGARLQLDAGEQRRSWSVLSGSARLKIGDREVELGTGEKLDTPLSDATPLVQPRASLEPLRSAEWARDFEQARVLADGLLPGVGSLTARRPNTQSQSQPLRLREQKVRVTIRGRVALTEIEQAFVNDSGAELEGTYRFPLPGDASISGLALLVGSRWMEGAMVEKTRARAIFKSIVDRVVPRDPALFEWEQGNVFKLKIFPIPPHGERRVRLSYTQTLDEVEAGQLRYRYPMGGSGAGATEIGKFSFDIAVDPENLAGVDLDRIQTPMSQLTRTSRDGALFLHHEADRFVPSHELGIDVPAPAQSFVTHRDRDGQNYFMLALRPEFAVEAPEAVDYVFVADRSHGTAPELWTAAGGLISASLEALDADDRFTVLACDTACDSFSPGLVAADPQSIAGVERFLGQQSIGGASDLGEMLEQAASLMPARSGATRVVVYLGDGVATSGEMSADGLVALAQGEGMRGVRLQAVGLGARTDALVLDELARVTGGDFVQAGISDELEGIARELQYRARVPAMQDLDLQLPAGAFDVHPAIVPPLRSGEALVVTGKLRPDAQTWTGAATLTRRSTGERSEVSLQADPARGAHPYLPRLWAAAQINWLTTHAGYDAKDQIVALSQDYTVMSRYTALLALENDAMYRQYAVRRRGHEKDQWRGELSAGVPRGGLARAQGQPGSRSAPLEVAANAAAPTTPTKSAAGDDDWGFDGERRRDSLAVEEELPSTTTVDEKPDNKSLESELAKREDANRDPWPDLVGGAEGKASSGPAPSADEPAPPEAEPSPSPKPSAQPSTGADFGDADKDALADASSPFPADDREESEADEAYDPFDAYDPGDENQSAPVGQASSSGTTTAKSPSKKKARKPQDRPRRPSGAADAFGEMGGAYDDMPMIARRPPPRPKLRIREASADGGYDAKLEELLRRRDAEPTDRARHRALVSAAMRAGDPRVVEWAADWAHTDPDHFRALIAHADALSMRAHPMRMRAYASAAEANPYSDDLHAWLAAGLEAEGDFVRACSHRRAIVSIDPAQGKAYVDLARCLDAAGRRGAALQSLQRGGQAEHDASAARRELARFESGAGEWSAPALPRGAAIRATANWSGEADFEVAFIDHRGRRLSAAHAEGSIYARNAPGESSLYLRRYQRPVYVEITRKDQGTTPVSVSLQLTTTDTRRRFDLVLGSGNRRVARVYRK